MIRSVVLVNAWHDDNKGDGGIVEATIEMMRVHHPHAAITIVSKLSSGHPEFPTAHRHLSRRFPEVSVLPLPNGLREPSGPIGRFTSSLTWVLDLPLAGVRARTRDEVQRLADAIRNADLVISVGGHYFFNRRAHPRDWGRLHRHLYPLLLARRYGVPYIMLGHSVGPFPDAVSQRLIMPVFRDAHAIALREEISRRVLAGFGISANVIVLPDVAFALQPALTPRVESILKRHALRPHSFWVVTVRRFGSERAMAVFQAEMSKLIRTALGDGLTERVVLVAHCHGPTPMEDDRAPTRDLARELLGEAVCVVEDDLSPRELSALYANAELTIGTRFHSVIFSLIGNTPAYAISYFGPKTQGIMEMLGMEGYWSNLTEFSAQEVLPRVATLKSQLLRTELQQKVEDFRSRLFRETGLLTR